jgi:hypothetical protein
MLLFPALPTGDPPPADFSTLSHSSAKQYHPGEQEGDQIFLSFGRKTVLILTFLGSYAVIPWS